MKSYAYQFKTPKFFKHLCELFRYYSSKEELKTCIWKRSNYYSYEFSKHQFNAIFNLTRMYSKGQYEEYCIERGSTITCHLDQREVTFFLNISQCRSERHNAYYFS